MNRPAAVIPVIIIVNACLWGFAMLMSSRALSGTGGYAEIQGVLGACAGASLIVVGGGLAAVATKRERVE
ncbi:MAG: hypothetical protein JXB46_11370 [Candidatus Eisenbacteria bacterium]|nr:hypothetical protein [Candidatus Eisenbacteria bacterium]